MNESKPTSKPTRTTIVFRHVAFEDLGSFASVLTAAGYAVTYHEVGCEPWPEAAETADLLIVLGGPIGVYETDKYPFLHEEIDVLRRRLSARRPTLGICLGAQLMAKALGASVYPGTKEIGYAPIVLTAAGHECLVELATMPVLHWHGDTFDLPASATLLASTEACRNQAFALDRHALAFQFHPEAGGAGFERWLVGHAVELAQAGIDPVALRAADVSHGSGLRIAGAACLRRWLARVTYDR